MNATEGSNSNMTLMRDVKLGMMRKRRMGRAVAEMTAIGRKVVSVGVDDSLFESDGCGTKLSRSFSLSRYVVSAAATGLCSSIHWRYLSISLANAGEVVDATRWNEARA